MIPVVLRRYGSIPGQGTFGKLITERFSCVTLEREWRQNEENVSAIPLGHYTCELIDSPHFGRVYEVKNVIGRNHILIHPANVQAELKGCIALGRAFGCLQTPATRPAVKWGITASRDTLHDFMDAMNNEDLSLLIERDI